MVTFLTVSVIAPALRLVRWGPSGLAGAPSPPPDSVLFPLVPAEGPHGLLVAATLGVPDQQPLLRGEGGGS